MRIEAKDNLMFHFKVRLKQDMSQQRLWAVDTAA